MMSENDDVTIPFGEEDPPKVARNPVAIFFHLFFRIMALVAYILGSLMGGFITIFVVTVVLLSLDFWTTKNITGRLLVGLRWWNYVDDQGKSNWVFESRKNRSVAENGFNSTVFWMSIIICELFWIILIFTSLFTFEIKWLPITCLGVCLNGANLYGYLRCKFGSHKQMHSNATNILGKTFLSSVFSRFTSSQNNSSQGTVS